ncbi:MAG: DUF1565 domain-containing protein, partial [Bacteroidetes bacterium]|nr:DUF1565 domain-containing protein [Bacteroidota bacterium]
MMKIFKVLVIILLISSAKAHVVIDFPVGGETFAAGDTINIQWHIQIQHNLQNWDLSFSPDGGITWQVIQLDLDPSVLNYLWIVPRVETQQGRIKIYMDNVGTDYQDVSGDFTIEVIPITIHVPGDYLTIQEAINISVDGDTIEVHPGTYIENINFNGHSIILTSLFLPSGDSSAISATIIDGNFLGSAVSFENGEDSTAMIIGFTIQHGLAASGGGIYCSNSNPTISNNIIVMNSAFEGGGVSCNGANPTITNNTITGNSADSLGGGIFCGNGSNPVITNTIMWNDSAEAGSEIFTDGTSLPNITYSNVQGGWSGNGNINCQPFFCSPDTGNYYLADNSCCIGTGEGGVDIGALGIGCSVTSTHELNTDLMP